MIISIIMPIYNPTKEYLKKAIESVINQTFTDFELVIILDGSPEKIKQICKKYEKKDNRIKIYMQKNKGEGGARNTGIKKAQGEWITFVDPDDWLEKDAIEKIGKYINKKDANKIDIMIFDTYINYKNKENKNQFYIKEGILKEKDLKEIQLQNIEQGMCKYYPKECNISVVWAKAYKRQFIIENNIKFVEKIKRYTDTIFNIEAFEKANNIAYYNEYIYHYRKNNFSITHNYYDTMLEDVNIFLLEVKKYIKNYKKDKDFLKTYFISVLSKIVQYLEMGYKNIDVKNETIKLKKEYYYELKMVPIDKIGIYKKMMLKSIQKENIFKIIFLIKIHNKLRKKY